MDIISRFKDLPRARRGDTTVVIVEETVLAELIADARKAGALSGHGHFEAGALTTITGGATGGAPMTIHVDMPPPGPDPAVVVEEILRRAPRPRRSSGW